MQILKFITLVILLASVPSCIDNVVDPTESGTSPIPFALGNRWTYVDSLYAETGLLVDTFSVTIVSSRTDNVGTWWTFNRRFNPSIVAVEFLASHDSIFSLQYTPGPSGIVPIRSLEYFWPLGSETIAYHAILDGDVIINKSISYSTKPLSIQARTFSSSLVIKYDVGEEKYRESVVPNVGMVDLEIINNSTIWAYQGWTRRRIQLLEFRVSQ